jgi:protein-disulfide isomerase
MDTKRTIENLIIILLRISVVSLIAGCSTGPNSSDSNRAAALTNAIDEAEQLGRTAEGIRYSRALSPYGRVLEVAAFHCAPSERYVSTASDFVFFISADGRVTKVLSTDPNASLCATVTLRNVRLPPPPKPGWSVHLAIAIGMS